MRFSHGGESFAVALFDDVPVDVLLLEFELCAEASSFDTCAAEFCSCAANTFSSIELFNPKLAVLMPLIDPFHANAGYSAARP